LQQNLIASILAVGGIIAAAEHVVNQDNVVNQDEIFSSSDNGFRNVILDHATEIGNAVQNMLDGRENPADVMYLIRIEYRGTSHDSKYSKEEIAINTEYRAYLNAAYEVAKAKLENSASLGDKIKLMNEAKAKLF
jgi:hypothetical protein